MKIGLKMDTSIILSPQYRTFPAKGQAPLLNSAAHDCLIRLNRHAPLEEANDQDNHPGKNQVHVQYTSLSGFSPFELKNHLVF